VALLVLSLFPGIGLLDMAFEEEGFCVVRGPDLLWGGDVKRFHPPAGKFDGVIGGPPCQAFSKLAFLQKHAGRAPRHGNLIPEFERCVREAAPAWFVMENVPDAPVPSVADYYVSSQLIDNRWVEQADGIGGEQRRVRRFSFGRINGSSFAMQLPIEYALLEAPLQTFAVTARHSGRMSWQVKAPGTVTASDGGASVRMNRYKLPEACRLQGVAEDFLEHAPFTAQGKLQAVANGVPLPMGRAIARAVRNVMNYKPGDETKADDELLRLEKRVENYRTDSGYTEEYAVDIMLDLLSAIRRRSRQPEVMSDDASRRERG